MEDFLQKRNPIYPGSNVTTAQCLLLVLTFYIRHHLTNEALDDLLSLLNVILPNSVPNTKYKFFKEFNLHVGTVQVRIKY